MSVWDLNDSIKSCFNIVGMLVAEETAAHEH